MKAKVGNSLDSLGRLKEAPLFCVNRVRPLLRAVNEDSISLKG